MDLTERASEVMDWIHVPADRDQWRAVVNVMVQPSIKGGEFIDKLPENDSASWSK
jgi:hypothetical protein